MRGIRQQRPLELVHITWRVRFPTRHSSRMFDIIPIVVQSLPNDLHSFRHAIRGNQQPNLESRDPHSLNCSLAVWLQLVQLGGSATLMRETYHCEGFFVQAKDAAYLRMLAHELEVQGSVSLEPGGNTPTGIDQFCTSARLFPRKKAHLPQYPDALSRR